MEPWSSCLVVVRGMCGTVVEVALEKCKYLSLTLNDGFQHVLFEMTWSETSALHVHLAYITAGLVSLCTLGL